MTYKKIILGIFISQILFLGVFGLESNQYYVIEQSSNLCGMFTKGTALKPNWLPEGWKTIQKDELIHKKFLANLNCENGNTEKCCKDLGYRYAGVPIGESKISSGRYAAEFLAQKSIIESQSYNPSSYQLNENISRKEIMKIIMNLSGKNINTFCREVFADVVNDWGCKYIESALDNNFIVGNQSFRPNDTITKTEALKLILGSRNIKKRYNTNSWQQDYISTAYYLGYIDEKFTDYNSVASRGWIFEVSAKTYSDYKY